MKPILMAYPGNETLVEKICTGDHFIRGKYQLRSFPDGETYLRLDTPCVGARVILVASLNQPNEKILPLLLLAETLRDLGAKRVELVAPYLAYLRQDKRFQSGEGITSKYFAKILSAHFDFLITVDPHLHRYHSLGEIYSVPCQVLSAVPVIAEWIRSLGEKVFLMGPDEESRQWVEAVAKLAGVSVVVAEKVRKGDREVEIRYPDLKDFQGYRPILIDDIISTGTTLAKTTRHLMEQRFPPPLCVGVHGIFAGDAEQKLADAGVKGIVTSTSISHPTNAIDISGLIQHAILNP